LQKRRKQAHPEAQNRQRLLQVSVQRGGGLLQGRDRQVFGRAQTEVVGVVADVAMGTPGDWLRVCD